MGMKEEEGGENLGRDEGGGTVNILYENNFISNFKKFKNVPY